MRTLALLGVVPHLRLLGLGSPSPLHISRHLVAGLLAGRPSAAPHTSAETPLPEIVAACNAFQPQALVGYPSVHALLAQEQLAGRLRIAPSVIAYAGEVLAPDMRERIREAWGVEPASMYSTTEAAMIASGAGRASACTSGRTRRWSRWSTNTTGRCCPACRATTSCSRTWSTTPSR